MNECHLIFIFLMVCSDKKKKGSFSLVVMVYCQKAPLWCLCFTRGYKAPFVVQRACMFLRYHCGCFEGVLPSSLKPHSRGVVPVSLSHLGYPCIQVPSLSHSMFLEKQFLSLLVLSPSFLDFMWRISIATLYPHVFILIVTNHCLLLTEMADIITERSIYILHTFK